MYALESSFHFQVFKCVFSPGYQKTPSGGERLQESSLAAASLGRVDQGRRRASERSHRSAQGRSRRRCHRLQVNFAGYFSQSDDVRRTRRGKAAAAAAALKFKTELIQTETQ